jgi:hypothetical protein
MIRALIAACLITLPNLAASKECVILLHGLARSEASFALLERSLRVQEFVVVNPGYSSKKSQLQRLFKKPCLQQLQHVKSCGLILSPTL